MYDTVKERKSFLGKKRLSKPLVIYWGLKKGLYANSDFKAVLFWEGGVNISLQTECNDFQVQMCSTWFGLKFQWISAFFN